MLYDTLPDKTRIRTNTRVTRVMHEVEGIKVRLQDGSVEEGDIVVGCDGVHSLVREQMWEIANNSIPGIISAKEKRCMKSTQEFTL